MAYIIVVRHNDFLLSFKNLPKYHEDCSNNKLGYVVIVTHGSSILMHYIDFNKY